jgi:hypothetical protein
MIFMNETAAEKLSRMALSPEDCRPPGTLGEEAGPSVRWQLGM